MKNSHLATESEYVTESQAVVNGFLCTHQQTPRGDYAIHQAKGLDPEKLVAAAHILMMVQLNAN